jgi:hypothetical protein
MDLAFVIHIAVAAVAFLSVVYLVFATAQKADGLLKPVGMLLSALLVAGAALMVAGHVMGKMGAHPHSSAQKPAAAGDAGKAGGGK